MAIDWFTFFAQICNFLILVWLLKRFLYKPVLTAMTKRQERIASLLEEARGKALESEAEKQRYLAMQDELKVRISGEMQKAKVEAGQFRDNLMATAREEMSRQRNIWLSTLRKEEASFIAETSQSITDYFQVLSNNALRELAGEDLEERIVSVFLAKLESHDKEELAELSAHVSAAKEPFVISTAFPLAKDQQVRVVERLETIFPPALRYEFAVEKSLFAGISVEVAGKKIHWDLGEYLKKFEKKLADYLETHPAMDRGQ